MRAFDEVDKSKGSGKADNSYIEPAVHSVGVHIWGVRTASMTSCVPLTAGIFTFPGHKTSTTPRF